MKTNLFQTKGIVVALSVAMLATSCSSSFKVEVEETVIPGGWEPYLELVPGKYKVQKEKFGTKDAMTVNLNLVTKRIGNFSESAFDDLFFKLYDKKGNEILGVPEFHYNCVGGGSMDVITRAVNENSGYINIRRYCDNGFKAAKSSAKFLKATDSKATNAPKILDCDLFETETIGYIDGREIHFTLHNGTVITGEFYFSDEGRIKLYQLKQDHAKDFDGKNLIMSVSDAGMRGRGIIRGIIDSESYIGTYSFRGKESEFSVSSKNLSAIEASTETITEPTESTETISDQPEQQNVISNSQQTDWDEILDEYEEYVDKYISLLKKASDGDISAITEYAEYMEKAMSISDKISNAEDDMTPAQIARYVKILNKMTEEAAKMN